jgi:pimeloyl-ACP methyl ester carboxylesterase
MKTRLAALAAAALAVANPGGALAQEELTAPGPDGALAGTLVRPGDGRPLVLIVPGSGPTDRDGNNPMGVTAAPYRLLAETLAEQGIGSLRIDKRGMFASKAAVADANAVTIAGYADDIAAWVESARAATGRDCVWLLGHSEGGLIALAAAQRVDHLCGLILVAAPGRPMSAIIRSQLQANPANAPLLEPAMAALDKLERGERVDVTGMHPALQGLFAPPVQGFLIDMFAYDPAALAAKVARPMLIVQGGTDLQIGRDSGDSLHAAQPAAEYVVVPAMNHVLKDIEADGPRANYAAYADPSLPVAPELVEAIADFLDPRAGKGLADR